MDSSIVINVELIIYINIFTDGELMEEEVEELNNIGEEKKDKSNIECFFCKMKGHWNKKRSRQHQIRSV